MNPENFFIKEGYKSRDKNVTLKNEGELPYWDEKAIKVNAYYQYHAYKKAKRLFKKNKMHSLCDLGCGAGYKLIQFFGGTGKSIYGVDQEHAIEYCKQAYSNSEVRFICDNLEDPKEELPIFDMVISSDVIEHLVNPDILLNYIKRISNKNTIIILSTPERDLLRGIDCMESNKPEHVREWNQEEFRQYLEYSGFEVIESQIMPFAKFTFNKEITYTRRFLKQRNGTHKTMQCITAKLR